MSRVTGPSGRDANADKARCRPARAPLESRLSPRLRRCRSVLAQSRYPRRQRDAIFLGLLLASDPFSELMIVQPDREARRPSRSEMDHERVVIGRTLLAALAFDLANEWHAGDTRMQPPHHLPASFAVL